MSLVELVEGVIGKVFLTDDLFDDFQFVRKALQVHHLSGFVPYRWY
jgi:hypothetical protein